MSADRFGTARLRDATLAAWEANPARFREDANAEEDHAHGYYRDRVVVELAQNAADAATRAGTPGRLLLRLVLHDAATDAQGTTPGRGGSAVASLLAANTGTPLDAEGLASLASLRASAKRAVPGTGTASDGTAPHGTAPHRDAPGRVWSGGAARTVGRFGVGFAAVRSVADRITVASTSGTVYFSLSRMAETLAGSGAPELTAEAVRRGDRLPVLRLPWPGPAAGPIEARPAEAHLAGTHLAEAHLAGIHRAGTDPTTPPAIALLDGGWDTVVHLELRDAAALDAARRQLDAVGDTLLLALPGLTSIEIDTPDRVRTVRDVTSRWVVATRGGVLPERLLLDRPVEERDRDGWQVTWAVPRSGPDPAAGPSDDPPSAIGRVIHAPTPTEEPCTVPAVLIGTFPLDPTRRHVAPGPLTDALVGFAGEVWADLLDACRGPSAPDPLDLLPTGLPAGALDAALRDAVVEATRAVPLFTPADGGPPLTAGEATVLDGPGADHPGATAVLGASWPALVEVAPRHRDALGPLGVERTRIADVVETIPGDDPQRRRALYDVFADADAATLEELATLPVRLGDGRVVRGARGLLVAENVPDGVLDVLGRWGVRLVGPDDAHPVLLRLGAWAADAAALARHPVLRRRVLEGDEGEDESEHESPASVLLELVGAAPASLRAAPWWGEALLPAEDGEPVPARGLVVPGSSAARWFDPRVLPPVAPEVAQRWGDAALVRIGVRTGLGVEHLAPDDADGFAADEGLSGSSATDLADALVDGTLADHPLAESLDGWDDYLELLAGAGAGAGSGARTRGGSRARAGGADRNTPGSTALAVVADLDAVRPEAWPEVLRALTTGEPRRALVEPVHLAGTRAPSYAAWWLRHRSGLGPGRPFALSAATGGQGGPGGRASALSRLLGPVPDVLAGLDAEVLGVLGGIADPADLDADGWHELLDALPPVGHDVDLAVAVAVWRGLARLASRGSQGSHTDDVAAVDDTVAPLGTGMLHAGRLPALRPDAVVVPSEQVAVADPMWAQHPDARPVMVVPSRAAEDVAHLLDLDLAAERADGRVTSHGVPASVPGAVLAVFSAAPTEWIEHEDLTVDGRRVDWWVTGWREHPDETSDETIDRTADPVPHAATTAGLAAALAHVVGWRHRDRLERLLLGDAPDDALLGMAGEEWP